MRPAGRPGDRGPSRHREVADAGFAGLVVLALAGVLTVLAGASVALGSVEVARHRAASVADLAALAAAGDALSGSTAACARARGVAEAAGGALLGCEVTGDVAEIIAQVRPPGRLARLGAATARARAGPGPEPAGAAQRRPALQ